MRQSDWQEKFGDDLNWTLSFANLNEKDTTKHVHRLHPNKGKFIPQLVEYFLDDHLDSFKSDVYFNSGDIILDPFCGSGTALVQANELNMHAIGIDVSYFNTLISNCKTAKFDIKPLVAGIEEITTCLENFNKKNNIKMFETALLSELGAFNEKFFHVYEYKTAVRNNTINEKLYAKYYEEQFLHTYYRLVKEFNINLTNQNTEGFINKWFFPHIIEELHLVNCIIDKQKNPTIKDILRLIVSRTMRSYRATTHSDLATLIDPMLSTYYCSKHYKICKPIFSILKCWKTYSTDTVKRFETFNKIKTLDTFQTCLTGDSRTINIFEEFKLTNPQFYELLTKQKINGIFSSPPYVGMINYHEQHTYAYELFDFPRNDQQEIDPLYKGQGQEAKLSYINGISDVLLNCKKYFSEDYDVFLLANDKHNLYEKIANLAGMKIVNQFKRPVLIRAEKDKNAYSEIIFHLKEN